MKRAALFISLLVVLALASRAQAQILTGSVIGTVRDESGAVLPGVTVTLASTALPGGPSTMVTTEKGEYRFPQLAPGTYALTMVLQGFSTYQEQDLQVAVGATIERIVTLKLATVAETITVSGETPMVDPRKVGVTTNLPEEILETLPIHRYMAAEYGKWAPGVAPSDPAGQGAGLSVMGSGTNENSVLIDGVNILTPSGGNWGTGDLDAAEEVQVVTLAASAEYQVAQGGVLNVVMKQGTNAFRFDGSGYWYPDALVSKPIKRNCNCPLGQTGFTNVFWRNYSAHVGGPIAKDRLWFYGGGNMDEKIQTSPGVDPNRAVRKHPFYSHASFLKVTWNVNDAVKFKQVYQNDWWGGQIVPTIQRPFETLNPQFGLVRTYASEVTATLSNTTLLTVRATGILDPHYPTRSLTGDTTTPYRTDQVTGLACCGVQNFGRNNLGRHGQAAKLNRYIQGAGLTQDVRFGVQFEEASTDTANAFPSGVQYSDVGGRPDQATFRSPYVSGASYRSLGFWGEDQITMGARLTVTLGLRFDRMRAISQDLPAVDNQLQETGSTIEGLGNMFTWKVWAPRVGFNVKLTEDGKTVARGSYGRAYRQVFTNDFANVHPGLSATTLARFNTATGGYTTIISVTDPRANLRIDSGVDAPFTDSFSIGLDRELMRSLGVGITYVHKEGQDQIGWRDIGGVYGTRTDVLSDGRTVTVQPLLNATSARLFQRTNGPAFFNRYNGLLLSLTKRMSQRWQANVSYTFSDAKGLAPTGATTGQDPNDYINAAGLLPTDRPNMFTATGGYELPKVAVLVSSSYMYAQGTPYAPQALISLPQGRRSVNIAPPDGTYRFPSQNLLSFRISKILFRRADRRLELATEIMNALQDKAFDQILTRNFFSPTFGQPANWIEPRRMNFLARVNF